MPTSVTKKKAEKTGEEKLVVEITQRKKKHLSPKQLAHLEKVKWKKGQSGNPQGARVLKNIHEVVVLARTFTEAAINRLGEIMHSGDIPAATRACEAILDRAWGKAPQVVELTGQDGKPIETKVVVELPQATTLAPQVMGILAKLGVIPKLIQVAVANADDKKLITDYEQLNK